MKAYIAKHKKDPSLTKIIIAIVLVGITVAGVVRFSEWFNWKYIVAHVEASAETDLKNAEEMVREGKTAEARQLLKPILTRVENPGITPRALMLQAAMDKAAGDLDAAQENLRKAAEDYGKSALQPVAAVAYARLLEERGHLAQAVALYRQIRENAPPELAAPALSGLAREEERQENLLAARELYRNTVRTAQWDDPAWKEAVEQLGRLNVKFVFSPGDVPESKVYRVAKGDSLTNIGIKLNTTQGMLMRANGISNPNRLRLNQMLKYTPKDFQVVIERSTCRLFLLDSDGLFKVYRTGLGKRDSQTTLGRYKIGSKEKNPTWFKPGSEPIPPGDPRNELGTRWMPLIPEEESLPSDLGIHGTINPDSIGKYSSLGCPRMHKEDVEELYDLIVRSTPVQIVDTYIPNETL